MNKKVVQCKYCRRLEVRGRWESNAICFNCRHQRRKLRDRGQEHLLDPEIPQSNRITKEDAEFIESYLSGVYHEQEIIEKYMTANLVSGEITAYLYYDTVAGVSGVLRITEAGMKKLDELKNKHGVV